MIDQILCKSLEAQLLDLLCVICKVSEEEALPELTGEEKGEGSISMKLYYRFFRAGGNILLLLAIIAAFVLGEVSKNIFMRTIINLTMLFLIPPPPPPPPPQQTHLTHTGWCGCI